MPGLNAEELGKVYPDETWRSRLRDITDLLGILADCVIPDDYAIPDGLNNAIQLTPAGLKVRDRLVRRDEVPAKEANLMCALTLGHDEIYVDVDRTDIDAIEESVDAQLKDRKIHLPFVYGRELYDAFASRYEDERDHLSTAESVSLLGELPIGVFQYGHYTTGPFGLLRARRNRSMTADRRVRIYHCSDRSCRALHPVEFQTSHTAQINKHRAKISDYLRDHQEDASEWWRFIAELNGAAAAVYGDRSVAVLSPLLGDALADDELRSVTAKTLKRDRAFLEEVRSLADFGDPDDFSSDRSRAECLQLLLLADEVEIGPVVDRLVRSQSIEIPTGEIRRAVSTQHISSGAFGLRGELGSLGLRFVAREPGFPLLRLRRLLDKLYVRTVDTDVEELEWQLRGIDSEDLDERLENFYLTHSPRDMLERLVLARKTNMITACEEVGLEEPAELDDAELVDTIMWKLGFPQAQRSDPHEDFWRNHEDLWALVQSSEIGASSRFMSLAGPYFAALEGILIHSLAFSAWALLVDHTSAETGFSYDDADDRRDGLALIDEIGASRAGSSRYAEEEVDLGNMVGAFKALSRHLESLKSNADDHIRPPTELPDFDGKTEIKRFLLRSTAPFLDLTAASQDRIIKGLASVTEFLTQAEVPKVRNDYAHYRRTAPEIDKLEHALEGIRQAVTRLETLGLSRLLFSPAGVSADPWGRRVHEYRGPRRMEHRFVRPTRFDWMGLPSVTTPAYLVLAAAIGEPSEILRFEPRFKSSYATYWSMYPKPRSRQSAGKPDTIPSESPESGALSAGRS